MYGLLLEGVRSFILKIYGDDMWQQVSWNEIVETMLQIWNSQVLKKAEIETQTFGTHEIYSEGTIERIVDAASKYLKIDVDTLMFDNGAFFVGYLAQFGYDAVLKVRCKILYYRLLFVAMLRNFFRSWVEIYETF